MRKSKSEDHWNERKLEIARRLAVEALATNENLQTKVESDAFARKKKGIYHSITLLLYVTTL